jgi:hypothetical protein
MSVIKCKIKNGKCKMQKNLIFYIGKFSLKLVGLLNIEIKNIEVRGRK